MKVGKPKSKRVPVRLRHKIEKSSAAKQRKQRKEAKKNPQWRSRLKKDPGVPNLFPYKAKVLAELEAGKRRKEEESQRRRDVAKAQREGRKVEDVEIVKTGVDENEDDELLDESEDFVEGEEMDVQDDSNPMAALLASAQARAQTYEDEDDEDDDDDEEDEEAAGLEQSKLSAVKASEPSKKALPKQALADPIKAASALVSRMQRTENGVQALLDHYQIPPLVTAGSDLTTRFLVDVARKRGRLGRGGVPNLHAAALAVLSDLNEERLQLPAEQRKQIKKAKTDKGEVQIVQTMAEPFKLEGLWGDDGKLLGGDEMAIEA